jgi:hypothetical protein
LPLNAIQPDIHLLFGLSIQNYSMSAAKFLYN